MRDFFISYNSADRLWAQGIGDWLDEAGYTSIIQAADFVAGSNFVSKMHTALQTATRMIMVLSPDYLAAKFPEAEWTAAFAKDPTGLNSTLIPVRVRECSPEGLLKPIVRIDLVGVSVEHAKVKFLKEIRALQEGKRSHSVPLLPPASAKPKKTKLSQKVKGDHNTNIQAGQINNLTIKMAGKKAPSIQPPDVVGANVEMRAYIEYLIDRYIDWRQSGIDRGIDKRRFHPSMIHRDIKRDFGARTYLVPQTRFRDLIHYLQVRINDTIKGRHNPNRNYHSYEEHLEILHGKKQVEGSESCEGEGSSLAEAVIGAVQSGVTSARRQAQTIKCISNLKQLGLAARLWANRNDDVLPADFDSLRQDLPDPKVASCAAENNLHYEILSPGASICDPSVVYAHCPFHNSVVLSDGSAHQLGKRRLTQKNGQWKIEPPL